MIMLSLHLLFAAQDRVVLTYGTREYTVLSPEGNQLTLPNLAAGTEDPRIRLLRQYPEGDVLLELYESNPSYLEQDWFRDNLDGFVKEHGLQLVRTENLREAANGRENPGWRQGAQGPEVRVGDGFLPVDERVLNLFRENPVTPEAEAVAEIPITAENIGSPEERARLFARLERELTDRNERVAFVYTIPQNEVPYILLQRVGDTYQFPRVNRDTPFNSLLEQTAPDVEYRLRHVWANFDTFSQPGYIAVAEPNFDESLLYYYARLESTDTNASPNWVLVRMDNLARLGIGQVQEPYFGFNPRPYVAWRGRQLALDPSVFGALHLYRTLTSAMASEGGEDLSTIARRISGLPPATTTAPAVVAPAPAGVAPAAPLFTPVALTHSERNTANAIINNAYPATHGREDPRRPGADYTPYEAGIATALSQGIGALTADKLKTVFSLAFSPERANKLADDIIEGNIE